MKRRGAMPNRTAAARATRVPVRGLVLTLALVAVLALTLAGAALAAPKPPLDHAGRWITDARGRVVVLHGWNMVYKVDSYRPADAGFGRDDARFLARHGFNTVRLGVIYKGLEPRLPGSDGEPGYRDRYLRSIARTENALARHGIYTMLDFHQDLYNERFQGEGLPDWAIVGDARTLPAQPRTGFPSNYLVMEALNRAFDHFWQNDEARDGRRLQQAFGAAWRHVAKRFRDDRNVLGYNLFNEPWPGSQWPTCANPAGCPAFDTQFLTRFSERVIREIREVDRRSLVWYAPNLTFDFGAQTWHGDTGDPHAGFAFNNYCLAELGNEFQAEFGGVSDGGCRTAEDLVLSNADRQSEQTGDALMMTEFAATDELETVRRVLELADRHMTSWQQWHYCGCDDPTTTATPKAAQALVKDPSKPPEGGNVKRGKLRVSARPYPQLVSGTPLEFDFDYRRKAFDLRYSTERADGTGSAAAGSGGAGGGSFGAGSVSEVFVPRIHYRHGYSVSVRGARVVSAADAGVLRVSSCRGAQRVRVQVRPGGGSSRDGCDQRSGLEPDGGDDNGGPGAGGGSRGGDTSAGLGGGSIGAPEPDSAGDTADSSPVGAAGSTATTSGSRLPFTGLGLGALLAVAAALLAAGAALRRRFGGGR